MAALTAERKTPKLGQDVLPSFPTNLGLGMAASAKCWAGGIVCLATAAGANQGLAVPGSATAGLVALGVAEKTVDNSAGAASALSIVPRQGTFLFNNSTGIDAIAAQHSGQDCYIVDDNTVALSNSGGTRPRAGVIVSVDSGTPGQGQPAGVWVLMGITGSSAAYGDPLPAFLDVVHQARFVVTTALAAYTKTAGVILANANGAWATQDGISNAAVGDIVLLPDGIAAAAADAGLWQITALGAAGSKFSLSRPADWASGSFGLTGSEINIAEGTLYAGTKWYHATAGNFTVDTTAMRLVPRAVTQSITLVAGTATITNVPVLSATKTGFSSVRTTANTSTATTGGYHPVGAITPGALGTASIVFDATVAAGTINVADISTLAVTIFN